jgi:hypothetical protein
MEAAVLFTVLACGCSEDSTRSPRPGGSLEGGVACKDAGAPDRVAECLERAGLIPLLDRGASVAGPDADHDGLRDDIDAFIAAQSYSGDQRSAVMQLARGLESAVTAGEQAGDAGSGVATDTALAVAARVGKALVCVRTQFGDLATGTHIVDVYEKLTANTRVRVRAYLAYDHALDKQVLARPTGDVCEN